MNNLKIYRNGGLIWHNYCGMVHNKFNPSIKELNSFAVWFSHAKLHRLDGPAVTYSSGNVEFWVNNAEYFSQLEYLIAVTEYKQIK